MGCGWHADATRYARSNPGRFGCELTPAGVTRYYTVCGHPAIGLSVTISCDLYGKEGGGRYKRFTVGGIRFDEDGARYAFAYARALANGYNPSKETTRFGLPKEAFQWKT